MLRHRVFAITLIANFFLLTFLIPRVYAKPLLIIKDVSASPDPFSPNGDGIEDTTAILATISASGFKPQPLHSKAHPKNPLILIWRLTIRNPQGKLTRMFIRREVIKDNSAIKVSQVWDGKDYRRRRVIDAKYSFRIDARLQKVKAKPAFGAVTVKTKSALSVSVSPDSWQAGAVKVNSVITTPDTEKITLLNDGQANTTYSLCLKNPQGWTASQTVTAIDTYILNAAFSDKAESIAWKEINHALSTSPIRATSTKFFGGQSAVNVPPNEKRALWLQFKAPTATAITTEQNIEVIISAELP